jgi:hypothetical protein
MAKRNSEIAKKMKKHTLAPLEALPRPDFLITAINIFIC